ncbi:uncharacterized protein MONOS_1268 [Monocercomonoides exilis]|uniref:uncharacterized protein n=1 Tax=Monocercomonoides exilis TaxID=2049356 RepID=UPI00355A28E7|nr:hypothetical protein MONOS_1268 [Monocercomonoides exilis]|eukprot:MONOS_1268.1-p1 / transcript=MONOS_1268.1 / gene=MONOS_1268 / organism=Monocercomonoides_exilis_PA203 / gene_product=unspecified product / transcript_product=unspecified product / location=Mono_scaffold00021:231038-231808(-) / protein_length=231 / sequence_SO=supercontig / SO=protein_coding / is_pseudo=false
MKKIDRSMYLPRRKVKVEVCEQMDESQSSKNEDKDAMDLFNQRINENSKNPISDKEINQMSKSVSDLLSDCISGYTQSDKESSNDRKIRLSEMGETIFKVVIDTLQLMRSVSNLSVCEMVVSYILLKKFIQKDLAEKKALREGYISQKTVGTILLCSIIIAIKYVREYNIIYSNKALCQLLHIQFNVICASEWTFLEIINYECYIDEKKYKKYFMKLVSPFEGAISWATK